MPVAEPDIELIVPAAARTLEAPPPEPSGVSPVHVANEADLAAACSRWLAGGRIAVDTEFVRTRTYYPRLGLIQIADAHEVYLVDPLAIADHGPLVAVLTSPDVLKVFHSCAEDLEVLGLLCGQVPSPVFDTQIAAAFIGGLSLQESYQNLVRAFLGISLGKGETRSNWLKRPLTEAQIEYAALDVAFLLPLADLLTARLEGLGRIGWVLEECERLTRLMRLDISPERSYLALGGVVDLSRRDLAVLREVAAWRERQAQTRNLPRSFVLPDKQLRALAKLKPTSVKKLARIEGFLPSHVRKYGKTLIGLIDQALQLPEESLPPRLPRPANPRKAGRAVQLLREAVVGIAEELGLPPELVARKKAVSELVRNMLVGLPDPLPDELAGWRRAIVTERLLRLLHT